MLSCCTIRLWFFMLFLLGSQCLIYHNNSWITFMLSNPLHIPTWTDYSNYNSGPLLCSSLASDVVSSTLKCGGSACPSEKHTLQTSNTSIKFQHSFAIKVSQLCDCKKVNKIKNCTLQAILMKGEMETRCAFLDLLVERWFRIWEGMIHSVHNL